MIPTHNQTVAMSGDVRFQILQPFEVVACLKRGPAEWTLLPVRSYTGLEVH